MKNSVTEFHIDGDDMNEGVMSLLEILKSANFPIEIDTVAVSNTNDIVWIATVESSELALSVLRILQAMKLPFMQMSKKDKDSDYYDFIKPHNQ